MDNEVRACKNRNCRKPLPEGYKFDTCEACRNKKAQNLKRAGEIAGTVLLAAGGVAIKLVSGGKIDLNLKK